MDYLDQISKMNFRGSGVDPKIYRLLSLYLKALFNTDVF